MTLLDSLSALAENTDAVLGFLIAAAIVLARWLRMSGIGVLLGMAALLLCGLLLGAFRCLTPLTQGT